MGKKSIPHNIGPCKHCQESLSYWASTQEGTIQSMGPLWNENFPKEMQGIKHLSSMGAM